VAGARQVSWKRRDSLRSSRAVPIPAGVTAVVVEARRLAALVASGSDPFRARSLASRVRRAPLLVGEAARLALLVATGSETCEARRSS